MQMPQEHFDRIRKLPERVPECAWEPLDQHRGQWTEDSEGASEARRRTELATTFAAAAQALTVAADHLFALARSLESPVMTFAPWTLARASIEASCTSRWLLDASAPPEVREARGLNMRLTSLRDQAAYVRSLRVVEGIPHTQAQQLLDQVDERIDHLSEIAHADGIEVLRGARNGRVEGFGERPPTTTSLLASYGLEDEFRLFSGVAHARQWATLPTGFRMVDVQRLTQDLAPDAAVSVILTSVAAWLPAAYRCFGYAGWDADGFARRCDVVLDEVGASDFIRPWRGSAGGAGGAAPRP